MTKLIPLNAIVQHNGEPLPEHFLVDENLTITMANGQGVTLALRLSPEEALGLAQHLYHYATLALEGGGLSNAETAGMA